MWKRRGLQRFERQVWFKLALEKFEPEECMCNSNKKGGGDDAGKVVP